MYSGASCIDEVCCLADLALEKSLEHVLHFTLPSDRIDKFENRMSAKKRKRKDALKLAIRKRTKWRHFKFVNELKGNKGRQRQKDTVFF